MYKKKAKNWLKHADFICIDFVCLQLSIVVAYMIRFGLSNPYADYPYRNVLVVSELISLFVIFCFETLKDILKRGKYAEFGRTLYHVLLVELLTIGYLYLIHRADAYSRTVTIWSSIFTLYSAMFCACLGNPCSKSMV